MKRILPKREISSISYKSNLLLNIIVGILAFACVYPFLFVLMISVTDERSLVLKGYKFFPEVYSLSAYRYIFKAGEQLIKSYGVTIFVTIVGTVLTVLLTALYAYALSRPEFKYRKFFNFVAFFTMLFGGGLVPFYIVATQVLNLKDSIWSLILPLLLNVFFIMVLRTFFKNNIPQSIIDAARIDGAGEFRIFFTIVMPLSLPSLATIGLFSALTYWNDWFNALLFINNPNLTPLQHMLMKVQNNMEFLIKNASSLGGGQAFELIQSMPQEATRMAMVILATGPIVLAYPFFQRYFIKGLTVGGVKE